MAGDGDDRGGQAARGLGLTCSEVTDTSGLSRVGTVPGPHVNVPPETIVTAGPEGPVRDPDATFSFAANISDALFECQLDTEPAWVACGPPKSYLALEDGEHEFRVRAVDPAGHVDPSPATRSFTVDTAAPQTTIDSGPSGATNDSTPTFGFSSSETGSTLRVPRGWRGLRGMRLPNVDACSRRRRAHLRGARN